MLTDKQIERDVMSELEWDPEIVDSGEIGVAVDNGIVALRGEVGSYRIKLAAELATRRVRGVKGVAEEITISTPAWLTPTTT